MISVRVIVDLKIIIIIIDDKAYRHTQLFSKSYDYLDGLTSEPCNIITHEGLSDMVTCEYCKIETIYYGWIERYLKLAHLSIVSPTKVGINVNMKEYLQNLVNDSQSIVVQI